jgi:ribose 5-phosphate isomerase A
LKLFCTPLAFFVAKLGHLLQTSQLSNIVGISTSERTKEQACQLGIPLSVLDDQPRLGLAINGAEEVDLNLNLVKGCSGALLQEKMVEQGNLYAFCSSLSPLFSLSFLC